MSICPTCGFESDEEARFCARCGHPLWVGASAGRRAPATVLFCDLVGSTSLGERVDPEILRELLSRYYATAGEVLRGHGGLVDKFIGDAVLCVFGLPAPREDDALRACRAACDLMAAVERLSGDLRAEFGVGLQVRIGVHTGEAVSGDPRRGEALMAGDVLNTAARLEQAAGAGEVLIGEPTYQLVRTRVRVEEREPVQAKGKQEPVVAYRLISALSIDEPPPAAPETRFVGRSEELATLREAFEEVVRSRRASIVLLAGEPGVGKSRLISEFTGGLPGEARVLTGRCLAYGEGVTYWPLREILDELAESNSRLLARALGDDEPDTDAVVEHLLRATGRRPGPLSTEECFAAVARLLSAVARKRPLVVIVEDLHWAEPRLLELLDSLNDRVADAPVLLVVTARSDLTAPGGPLRAATVRLEGLDPADARALLESRGVAAERMEEMARAAGGNPLFLEQLHAAAAVQRTGTATLELGALLAARLGELERAPREVLEAASVVGHEFWTSALRALLADMELVELAQHLQALEQLEFIREGRALDRASIARSLSGVFGLEGRYSFRHGLIRDAARHAMSKRGAAALHERFAAFLEEQAGENVAEYEASIAWHLEEAARLRAALAPAGAAPTAERAAELLESAGRRALEQDDPEAAERFRDRAATMLSIPALLPDDLPEN